MKIKLTPELSYLIGLWKSRRIDEGIGIAAPEDIQSIFAATATKVLGIPPNKLLVRGSRILFHHSAFRKFFQEVAEDQLERFRWRNEFAANYLAGVFDGCGGVEGGAVYLSRASLSDRLLLERLGFRTLVRKGKLYLHARSAAEFIDFILPYVKNDETKKRLRSLRSLI